MSDLEDKKPHNHFLQWIQDWAETNTPAIGWQDMNDHVKALELQFNYNMQTGLSVELEDVITWMNERYVYSKGGWLCINKHFGI